MGCMGPPLQSRRTLPGTIKSGENRDAFFKEKQPLSTFGCDWRHFGGNLTLRKTNTLLFSEHEATFSGVVASESA
jgi:hypothetical protein